MASGNVNIQTGGGGAVDSVFGRIAAVVAQASDYDASQIDNDSGVSGSKVSDALDTLKPVVENLAFYVDKNGSDSNTGSKTKPYLTIQKALDQVTAATDSATVRRVWCIFINTGTYDESLIIDIGRKKVLLIAAGPVSIGTFGGSNWAPTGTTRNITVTCSLTNIDSIRCSFGMIANTRIQAYGTHQAYGHNFRVSGSLIISNSTGGTSGELNLQGVTFFGWDGIATGNNDSITAGSWAGNLNLYADNCRFYGLVTGGVVRLQGVRNCAFEKLATVATYSQIWFSEIKAGMTWTVAPTEVSPSLIACSTLTGTFTGGAGVNLLLDDVSNYFFIVNGATVAGGAAKVIISDAMHLAGTEIVTGDKRFSGSLKAGDGTNNSEFESDGTLKFNGTATVFDDLPPVPLLSQRVGGLNNPTLTAFQGNIQLLTFAVNDYVYFNYEFMHDYKQASAGEFHIHWATNGTEGVDKAVKWEIEYSIANLKAAAPFDSVFPASTTISVETVIPANTASLAHIVSTFGTLTLTGINIGAYVTGRIRRIASAGTAPAANPFGITIGLHVEKDTCGSRTMYTK